MVFYYFKMLAYDVLKYLRLKEFPCQAKYNNPPVILKMCPWNNKWTNTTAAATKHISLTQLANKEAGVEVGRLCAQSRFYSGYLK